jgi:hypothetical protein
MRIYEQDLTLYNAHSNAKPSLKNSAYNITAASQYVSFTVGKVKDQNCIVKTDTASGSKTDGHRFLSIGIETLLQ